MQHNTFKERQHFNNIFVYLLLVVASFGALFGLAKNLFFAATNMSAIGVYLAILFIAGVLFWWLTQLQLKVSVNENRIKYKFSPLHKQSRKIFWEEIASCQIIRTPITAQWHGGNLRFAKEYWFSLVGRNGLEIETKAGQHFFIGCKNLQDLIDTIDNFSETKFPVYEHFNK